jgi:hypothetical protein
MAAAEWQKWCKKSHSPSRSTGIVLDDDDGRRGTSMRENVTARSQVRDGGQAGASRARGDQRPPQEAGFFAGSRYTYYKTPVAGRPTTNGSGVSIR